MKFVAMVTWLKSTWWLCSRSAQCGDRRACDASYLAMTSARSDGGGYSILRVAVDKGDWLLLAEEACALLSLPGLTL
jgi:hypothetical protein